MKHYWVFLVWEDWTNGDCKTFANVYLADSEQKAISFAKTQVLSMVTGDGKISEITSWEL